VRYVCFAGPNEPTHGVDVTGFVDRGVASLKAHSAYLEGLGDSAFDPAEFLSWVASASGVRLGVDYAVLFDVHELIPDSAPPWVAPPEADPLTVISPATLSPRS
jgi:hypothetical protein